MTNNKRHLPGFFLDCLRGRFVVHITRRFIALGVVIAALCAASSCGALIPPDYPIAEKGIIDLTAWDFSRNSIVPLRGEWKFAWKRDGLEFAKSGHDDAGWDTLKVPGYWNKHAGTGDGYGWYRLRVKMDGATLQRNDKYGIKVCLIQSAFEMYVNGRKVMSSGVFGTTPDRSLPNIRPRIEAIELPVHGEETVISVRNSNFHHRSGGPYSIPEFGLHSALAQREFHYDIIRLVVIGIIIMMGIYHVMLWLGRREDRASLYFSAACLAVFMRLLATSGFLERMFPDYPMYEIHFKIVYASMPLVWVSLALFFRELFREEFSGKILRIFVALGAIFTAATLALPCRIYSVYSFVYEGLMFLAAVWALVCIIIAAIKKRPGALQLFPGFLCLFVTLINDILAVKLIINTPEIAPIGLVVFIFFQAAVISNRFSTAYRTAEHLSIHLQREVDIKTSKLMMETKAALDARAETEISRKEIVSFNERLNALYMKLKTDLDVAKKIQDALFPNVIVEAGPLLIHARYIPLIEVGGDVYDVCLTDNGLVRIFLADATGHGISASLITMLIKGEYDMLKQASAVPLNIISELNEKLYRNYKAIIKLFTCVLIEINPAGGTITHVSAGHPAQYLIRDGEIIELAATGRALVYTEQTNCREVTGTYRKSDMLFLFTDGLYEQFGDNGTLFGEDNIRKIVKEFACSPIETIIEKTLEAVMTATAGKMNDDITVLGVE